MASTYYRKPRWCSLGTSLSLLVLLCAYIGVVHSAQHFEQEPASTTARHGDSITLPCRVLERKGVVQWTKDGFGLGTDHDLSGFSRYRMVVDDATGGWGGKVHMRIMYTPELYFCRRIIEANRSDTLIHFNMLNYNNGDKIPLPLPRSPLCLSPLVQYDLSISPVLVEDDGVYQCQVGGGGGDAHITSALATLTVHFPPKDAPDKVGRIGLIECINFFC